MLTASIPKTEILGWSNRNSIVGISNLISAPKYATTNSHFAPTTIPTTKDDWSIEGLCLLRESRAALKDDEVNKLFQVRARNRNRMLREMMQFLTKCGCLLWILATV